MLRGVAGGAGLDGDVLGRCGAGGMRRGGEEGLDAGGARVGVLLCGRCWCRGGRREGPRTGWFARGVLGGDGALEHVLCCLYALVDGSS